MSLDHTCGPYKGLRLVTLLRFEMEKGGYEPGMWLTSRTWERHRNRLSQRTSRKEQDPANTLIFPHWFLILAEGSCFADGYASCVQWVVNVESLIFLVLIWDYSEGLCQPQSTVCNQLRPQLLSLPHHVSLSSSQVLLLRVCSGKPVCMSLLQSLFPGIPNMEHIHMRSCLRMESQRGASREKNLEREIVKGKTYSESQNWWWNIGKNISWALKDFGSS